jgi:membrane protease subunit HflK
MERVLGGMDKIIIDEKSGGSGVIPYLPLGELQNRSNTQPSTQGTGQ